MLLAADPPEISMDGPIASYRRSARSVSMSVIAPLSRPWVARNASSSWLSTSTSALPTPTTSMRLIACLSGSGASRRAQGHGNARVGVVRRRTQAPTDRLHAAVQGGALLERTPERVDDR